MLPFVREYVSDGLKTPSEPLLVDPQIGQVNQHPEAFGRSLRERIDIDHAQDSGLTVAPAGFDDSARGLLKEAVVQPAGNA
jgi:hypothetical protein